MWSLNVIWAFYSHCLEIAELYKLACAPLPVWKKKLYRYIETVILLLPLPTESRFDIIADKCPHLLQQSTTNQNSWIEMLTSSFPYRPLTALWNAAERIPSEFLIHF